MRYKGSESEVVIPSYVTGIADSAFEGNTTLEKVTLPANLESIGYNSFNGCTSLKRIIIPDSVSQLGESAFSNCSSLEYVYFGENLSKLGKIPFIGCDLLENIDISEKNKFFTFIDGVLYNADRTEMIFMLPSRDKEYFVCPDTVTNIDEYAFWNCRNIKHISISDKVDKINEYSFANSSLVSVALPYNLESIGYNAFKDCKYLEQVYIPPQTATIDSNAFDGCSIMKIYTEEACYANDYADEHNIRIIKKPKYDLSYANTLREDAGNKVKKEEKQPEIVKEMQKKAEQVTNNNESKSDDLAQTVIGSSKVVGGNAFVILDNKKINVISGHSVVHNDTIRGNIIGGILKEKLFYSNKEVKSVYITDDCKEIGRFCFARSGVSKVVIPDGVKKIDYAAFYHCDNLKDITIPDSVTTIEEKAFEHTAYLEDFYAESANDYLIVGDGVLLAYKCSDDDFSLPDTVKSVACTIPSK